LSASTLSPTILHRMITKVLRSSRDQTPSSQLIRQTAKKEWKLISITFFCSLLQAAAEGLTLGVMFLAVQVLSTPTAGTLSISKLPYLNAIPKLADIFHGITTFQAFTWLLSIAVILKLIQGFAMYLGSIRQRFGTPSRDF
jgi:hypothetical protein